MKKNPLIVALDVDSLKTAQSFVQKLKKDVSCFKIGSVLFTAEGPDVVRMVHDEGGQVFLDLKFHDIPNTVAKACEVAAKLGVFLVNVHASGGEEMLRVASQSVQKTKSHLIGVTVLTSQMETKETPNEVVRLAKLCQDSGLAGVVCSAHEIEAVRKACGKNFLIVTPGIRPAGSMQGDQKRFATPAEAVQKGADYIVIGRPILESKDPLTIVQSILRSL